MSWSAGLRPESAGEREKSEKERDGGCKERKSERKRTDCIPPADNFFFSVAFNGQPSEGIGGGNDCRGRI